MRHLRKKIRQKNIQEAFFFWSPEKICIIAAEEKTFFFPEDQLLFIQWLTTVSFTKIHLFLMDPLESWKIESPLLSARFFEKWFLVWRRRYALKTTHVIWKFSAVSWGMDYSLGWGIKSTHNLSKFLEDLEKAQPSCRMLFSSTRMAYVSLARQHLAEQPKEISKDLNLVIQVMRDQVQHFAFLKNTLVFSRAVPAQLSSFPCQDPSQQENFIHAAQETLRYLKENSFPHVSYAEPWIWDLRSISLKEFFSPPFIQQECRVSLNHALLRQHSTFFQEKQRKKLLKGTSIFQVCVTVCLSFWFYTARVSFKNDKIALSAIKTTCAMHKTKRLQYAISPRVLQTFLRQKARTYFPLISLFEKLEGAFVEELLPSAIRVKKTSFQGGQLVLDFCVPSENSKSYEVQRYEDTRQRVHLLFPESTVQLHSVPTTSVPASKFRIHITWPSSSCPL